MRKLLTAVAVVLISTSAQADVHEVTFGGSTWRIEIPGKCRDLSCIRVSEKDKAPPPRARKATKPVKSAATPAPAMGPKVATPKVAVPPPVASPAAVAAMPASAPANVAKTDSKIESAPAEDSRLPLLIVEDATPAPQAAANKPRPELRTEPVPAESSPLGLWLTEKGEGRVRIEPCGPALCGHTDGKPNEKILINMRLTQKNRWNGKINDVRAGGTYLAQMSLTNADALRVEGCAFGGMFCGSQTWTRVQ
jgi:Uncharacterized protein conserved in bacteria (DUF2147)